MKSGADVRPGAGGAAVVAVPTHGDPAPGAERQTGWKKMLAEWFLLTRWPSTRAAAARLATQGRWAAACACVEELAVLCPDSREVSLAGWGYAARSEDPRMMSSALHRLFRCRALPERELAELLADLIQTQQHRRLSWQCLRQGEASYRSSPQVLWLLGLVYFVRHEPEWAQRCWEASARVCPQWLPAWLLLSCLRLPESTEAEAHPVWVALDRFWVEEVTGEEVLHLCAAELARGLVDHVSRSRSAWRCRIWEGYLAAHPSDEASRRERDRLSPAPAVRGGRN